MKAKIEYRMMKMPDPWNEEMRKGEDRNRGAW